MKTLQNRCKFLCLFNGKNLEKVKRNSEVGFLKEDAESPKVAHFFLLSYKSINTKQRPQVSISPIVPSMDNSQAPERIVNDHEETKLSAQQKPSKGGWRSAIFVICKSQLMISFIFNILTQNLQDFSHICNGWCSCGSGREILILWSVGEPHHLPHYCSWSTHCHGCQEREYVGWCVYGFSHTWSHRGRFLPGSIQDYYHIFHHLFYGGFFIIYFRQFFFRHESLEEFFCHECVYFHYCF